MQGDEPKIATALQPLQVSKADRALGLSRNLRLNTMEPERGIFQALWYQALVLVGLRWISAGGCGSPTRFRRRIWLKVLVAGFSLPGAHRWGPSLQAWDQIGRAPSPDRSGRP